MLTEYDRELECGSGAELREALQREAKRAALLQSMMLTEEERMILAARAAKAAATTDAERALSLRVAAENKGLRADPRRPDDVMKTELTAVQNEILAFLKAREKVIGTPARVSDAVRASYGAFDRAAIPDKFTRGGAIVNGDMGLVRS